MENTYIAHPCYSRHGGTRLFREIKRKVVIALQNNGQFVEKKRAILFSNRRIINNVNQIRLVILDYPHIYDSACT